MKSLIVVPALIAVAWLCGRLARRFGQPPVIGELVAGIAIGPSVLGTLVPQFAAEVYTPSAVRLLEWIAQTAILGFMFLVGLELDLTVLRRHAHGVVRIAVYSLVAPFALGCALALALYPSMHGPDSRPFVFTLFVGTAMSITALPVLTRMLSEWRMLQTTIGTIVVGCAAIDDIVAWALLGMIVGLTRGDNTTAVTLGLILAYLGLMLFIVRPALAWLVGQRHRRGCRVSWIIAVIAATGLSAFLADRVGIHAVIGAFLAGVCVPRRKDVLEGLEHPLSAATDVLLPAFFVVIGLKTEVALISGGANWATLLAITFCATLGKLGGSAVAARSVGFSWRESLAVGSLLNTPGLVALVVLDIGRELGILSAVLFTIFVVRTLITTLATAPLIWMLGVRPHPAIDATLTEDHSLAQLDAQRTPSLSSGESSS